MLSTIRRVFGLRPAFKVLRVTTAECLWLEMTFTSPFDSYVIASHPD